MTEAEQLQILEKIPGFSRPSAEWLAGLEVGDRVMIYILEDNGSVEWGSAIVEDKYLHSFDLRYRDALYTVNRSGDLTEGGGEDRIWTYWISPIEPKQPQQKPNIQLGDWVATSAGCGLVILKDDTGNCTIENQYRLMLKANVSECTVLFSPKFRMNDRVIHWHFVGTVKEVWYDNDRDVEAFTYLVHFEGPSETMWCREEDLRPRGDSATIEPEPPRQGAPAEEDDEDDWLTGAVKAATKFKSDLHQIAAQLGIPTDDQMMAAIGRRLSELLETEELYQASLPVPYGDRS